MFVQCARCPLRVKPFFRPFSAAELKFVSEFKTDHIVVAPRVDIIQEDEVGGPAYTLFEGWAFRITPKALARSPIYLLGDIIGLASALLGTDRHSGLTLEFLSGRTVTELFNRHAGLAETRVEEEQRADVRLSLLGRSNAEQRIGYLMLETFDRLRQRGMVNGVSTCPLPLQAAISPILRGCPGFMLRTRSSGREQRLATIQDGVLVLLDRPRLADLARYVPLRVATGRRAIV